MAFFILKIGEGNCPSGKFRPENPMDWEGQAFLTGNTMTIDRKRSGRPAPNIGDEVLVWTHHERRTQDTPGEGLKAVAQVQSVEPVDKGFTVTLKSVKFFRPAISLGQVKTISNSSKALTDLIEYAPTHTLCLNDQETTELKELLRSKWPSSKEDLSGSGVLNSNSNLPSEPLESTSLGLAAERNFVPSKGLEPTFGSRVSEFEDGMHYIYMFLIEGFSGGMTGISDASLANGSVIKIGFSKNPAIRLRQFNAAFPPASKVQWKIKMTSKPIENGKDAKNTEDLIKARFTQSFKSLGREFFFGQMNQMVSEFSILVHQSKQ